MTKDDLQKQNEALRNKIAAYEALGSPEFIKEKLDMAENALSTNAMIRKLLA